MDGKLPLYIWLAAIHLIGFVLGCAILGLTMFLSVDYSLCPARLETRRQLF